MDNSQNVFYIPSNNTVDIVLLNKVNTVYPMHTHAEHYTMGIVIEGEIMMETNNEKYVCKADHIFSIPIDVAHSIKLVSDCPYPMISFCIHQDYLVQTDVDSIKSMIDKKLNQTLLLYFFGKATHIHPHYHTHLIPRHVLSWGGLAISLLPPLN